MLDTVGTRRFRVLEWGTKDGYATARVEWLIDDDEDAPRNAKCAFASIALPLHSRPTPIEPSPPSRHPLTIFAPVGVYGLSVAL